MHNPYKSDSLIKAVGRCLLLNASVPMKEVIVPLTEVTTGLYLLVELLLRSLTKPCQSKFTR